MQFHLSIPLSRLEENLDFVDRNGFQPEIRMTKVNYMMGLNKNELAGLRSRIDSRGFRPFTHGPFFGLDVASLDKNISEYSIRAMVHGIDATAALGGDLMVIHTGYLPQFSRGGKRHWFRNWAERMPFVIEAADKAGVTIALENTWDDRPEILLRLADLLRSDSVRFCIDTGHVNAFSRLSIEKWWRALETRLAVLHLHDNDGFSDDHLVPGRGTFDFHTLAGLISELGRPLRFDLEIDLPNALDARDRLVEIFNEG